jgi:hypothetical protein
MFPPCWVIFRKNFLLPLHWGCTLQLSENVLLTVYWRRELSVVRPERGQFTPPKTTQYTVNSTFLLNCKVQPQCNGNKKFSLKMTQQGRNM